MADNYNDTRDEYEVEFDNKFLDDSEVEDMFDTDESSSDDEVTESNETEYDNQADGAVEESDSFSSDVEGSRISRSGYVKEITQEEANELKRELSRKRNELQVAREKLSEARDAGDLSENEAYVHFREVVSGLESDIASIESELKSSHIISGETSNPFIHIGSKVHLIITSKENMIEKQDLTVSIVSEGHGGIVPETGEIRVPANSEVYRNMADMQAGEFELTGTDGNNYHYKFNVC